jgi:peroxiredoxin
LKIKKLFLLILSILSVIIIGILLSGCCINIPLDSLISKSTDTSASKTAKNEIANNFTLLDLDKNKVSLSDFKDKVVVLNFWATWCPPCRAEIPDFIEVYSTYKGKDVQFLGISGDNVNALTKFVQENKINYPTLIDGSIDTIMPKWGIEAIPTTFILNGNGEVLFSNVGMMSKDQLINAIEKSLNSLK